MVMDRMWQNVDFFIVHFMVNALLWEMFGICCGSTSHSNLCVLNASVKCHWSSCHWFLHVSARFLMADSWFRVVFSLGTSGYPGGLREVRCLTPTAGQAASTRRVGEAKQ